MSPQSGGSQPSIDLYLKAKELFHSRLLRESILHLSRLRGDESYSVRANANIASCLLLMGHPKAALKFTTRSLGEDPSFPLALANQIKAFHSVGRHDHVDILCKEYIEAHSDDDEIWHLWLTSLRSTNQDRRALDIARDWLIHLPKSINGLLAEGELLSDLGEHHQAIATLSKALKLSQNSERAYSDLSVVLMRASRFEDSIQYVNKALELNPGSLNYCCRKALALWLIGDWKEASTWYAKTHNICPDSAIYFLNQYMVLPGIPRSNDEINEARSRYHQGLDKAESDLSLRLNFNDEAIPHTFGLAYHNRNDRELLEKYFSLMRKLSKPLIDQVNQRTMAILKDRESYAVNRIRIGFASRFFSGHSNTIAFSGLIRNLNRENFEITLIHLPNSKKDHIRDSLDSICDKSIELCSNLIESGVTLKSLDLDIIFFTDLGMNANDYFLPFVRAAPIQMTGWGIPHTSGMQEIDYYISAEGLEPSDADKLYTENLVRLSGCLPCCFEAADLRFNQLPREYFFLPPDLTLIGCLQGLHKLHPDFDLALEQIATLNPDVAFVFVEDSIASRTQIFLDRLSANAPLARERCILMSIMGRGEYHALCDCVDILLDPFYYGSGITFFEASYVGTPIVTLEGENLRTRVVANGYREMKLDDPPITANTDEYVELVTHLCNDVDRRARLKSSILANNFRVFDRIDYVRGFEEFCLSLYPSF